MKMSVNMDASLRKAIADERQRNRRASDSDEAVILMQEALAARAAQRDAIVIATRRARGEMD